MKIVRPSLGRSYNLSLEESRLVMHSGRCSLFDPMLQRAVRSSPTLRCMGKKLPCHPRYYHQPYFGPVIRIPRVWRRKFVYRSSEGRSVVIIVKSKT